MNNTTINTTAANTTFGFSAEAQAIIENGGLSAKDVINARHIFTSSEKTRIMSIEVKTSKKSKSLKTKAEVVGLSENLLFVNALKRNHFKVTVGDGNNKIQRLCDGFVEEFVQIAFDEKSEALIHDSNFDMMIDIANKRYYAILEGEFLNLNKGNIVKSVPAGCKLYHMLSANSGDLKANRALFFMDSEEHRTNYSLLEKTVPGFISNVDRKLLLKDVSKLGARAGMLKTSGKLSFTINDFVVIPNSLDIVTGMSDGKVDESAAFMHDIVGVTKTDKQSVKLSNQGRVNMTVKGTTQVMPTGLFEEKVNLILSIADKTKTVAETINGMNVTNYFDAKGELVATVYGDVAKATHIIDCDALKANIDLTLENNRIWTWMSVAHLSTGHLNSQVNESVVSHAIDAGLVNEMNEFYDDLFNDFMAKCTEDVLLKSVKMPSLDDVYALNILESKMPNNPICANSRLTAKMNTIKNTVSGLSFEMYNDKGVSLAYNALLSCDPSAQFGVKLIKDDEVFCAGINALDGDEFKVGIITKAPKTGDREYFKAKFVTVETIIKRIKATDLSDRIKAGLIFLFENSPEGVVYFPSSKKTYQMLAGSDNDGDKVQMYFHKFMVEILNKSKVVVVDVTDKGTPEVKVNNKFMDKLKDRGIDLKDLKLDEKKGKAVGEFIDIMENNFVTIAFKTAMENKLSVGIITYWNNRCLAIANTVKKGDLTYALQFFKENGMTEGINDVELVVDDSVVSPRFAEELKAAMCKVVWNRQNVKKFFYYINEVFRAYQEGTIDADKTGEFFETVFKCDSVTIERLKDLYVKTGERGEVIGIAREESKSVKVKTTKYNGVESIEINLMHLVDEIGTIENRMVDFVNNEWLPLIRANEDLFRYSDAHMVEFSKTIKEVEDNMREVLDSMFAIKYAYNAVVRNRIAAGEDADRDYFKAELDALANAIRQEVEPIREMLGDEADMFISELLLAVGCGWKWEEESEEDVTDMNAFINKRKVRKLDATRASKFAYSLCPEYSYSYFVGGLNYISQSIVISDNKGELGQTVSFSRGVSADGIILNCRYTGEAVITEAEVNGVTRTVAVANKTFERKAIDCNKSLVIFKKIEGADIEMTRNSTLSVSCDGNIYFCQDVEKDSAYDVVGATASMKTFTGTREEDYYVDDVIEMTINTKNGRSFEDVPYYAVVLAR